MKQLQKGDYVVATKYADGDPKDHFCVGFFDSMTWHNRYNIVTNEGELFRHNGFRRAKKIREDVGAKIVAHIKDIEMGDRSVWSWVRQFERE